MKEYFITYHFEKGLYVTRKVKTEEGKNDALISVTSDERQTFEDEKGTLYSFLMADVKLVSIEEQQNRKVGYQ